MEFSNSPVLCTNTFTGVSSEYPPSAYLFTASLTEHGFVAKSVGGFIFIWAISRRPRSGRVAIQRLYVTNSLRLHERLARLSGRLGRPSGVIPLARAHYLAGS